MTNKDLGYNDIIENSRKKQNLGSFDLGRVVSEHKERYGLRSNDIEYDAELIGNLRFSAENRYDFPAVGDWVAFSEYDEGKAMIHAILPRTSILKRQAVGKSGQIQIIATNIDYGLLVQAVDRDFNLNRLERYLTICNASKVEPIIVLTKIDLISEEEVEKILEHIDQRLRNIPVCTVSSVSKGYEDLKKVIEKGKTYCLLGSSGVGKSTIINFLSGKEKMKTKTISSSVNKGRHTTSHRELFVLENGGILIDNPGMREVGITETTEGLELTFESIFELSRQCKYRDCTHIHENGCAIIEAIESGDIEQGAYDNFLKMEKERMHFESDAQERKKKDKAFGKMVKNVKNQRKKSKF